MRCADLKKDVKPVGSSSELIVQEYVDRPLLIDGRYRPSLEATFQLPLA